MSGAVGPREDAGPAQAGDDGSTGDPRVDTALARLTGLDSLSTAEHVAVYEDVHQRLQDALADVGKE